MEFIYYDVIILRNKEFIVRRLETKIQELMTIIYNSNTLRVGGI